MSTKPTETGWSKEWPATGCYWRRRIDRDGDTVLAWIHGDTYRLIDGCTGFRSELYEWLGPISPSDFEQLLRLRKASVLLAIPYEALLMDAESKKWIAPKVWTAIENAVVALREALTHKMA